MAPDNTLAEPGPAPGDLPREISGLIDGAVAAFDADRSSARSYLRRASTLLRATQRSSTAEAAVSVNARRRGLAAWQINRLIDYIESNLAEKMTGRQLASLVHLSVGELFRAFRVSVGTPPFHYILLRRVELACILMKTTREPLSQVAAATGLSDQAHLCRVFRRVVGVTPAAWRRANEPQIPQSPSEALRCVAAPA